MKHTIKMFGLVISIMILVIGCASKAPKAVITLKDGREMHSIIQPKLNNRSGFYTFKELSGKEIAVNKDEVLSVKIL